jgi:hypothetical protein
MNMPNGPTPEPIPKPVGDPLPPKPEPEPKPEAEPKPLPNPQITKAGLEPVPLEISGSKKWEVHTKDKPDPNPVFPKGQE